MKPIHILLVEDNEGDILLTTEALNDRKIANEVSIARDGTEALDFLRKTGKFSEAATPDLILLDINLPKMNGHDVLGVIKNDDELKKIPVIMLTTSSSKRDIDMSYEKGANCYITKPVDMDDFLHTISSIENFWISVVQLPTR
ncbi:MAG: response regulator [Sediminibacterium sp. Gen4]|uniref:response regulator n=1 Tax=unclassified Sediminibacterium TaxID=2635961 RepID=UPI0015BCE919|nr:MULTISPECIES: response regulator [unclassified Sediminibacterium]MBW0162397.1 response regulator [Sediminibacterium sp.]MBW0164605.1 response regulator [Sediminibacterium sp.]MDZ4071120.1 response regulator [Sediminibacterium sp.]NWK66075.1 response regulator [Sediminibacterium sp. Gen4]